MQQHVMMKTCKVAVIGSYSVGKTCLTMRFIGKPIEFIRPTIGASFVTISRLVGDKLIRLELWDTAGQERYAPLLPMYVRACNIVLLCFDCDTAENISAWEDVVKQHSPAAKIIYVATKIDDENSEKDMNLKLYGTLHTDAIYTSAYQLRGIQKVLDTLFEEAKNIIVEEYPTLPTPMEREPKGCTCALI
jgi:small GTP-binding protein